MRRFLSIAVLMSVAATMMGQGSMKTALTLQEGNNTYKSSSITYWTYQSPTDQATLMELTPLAGAGITAYLGDGTLPAQSQVVEYNNTKYYVLVGPEEKVYLAASDGSGFNAHLECNTNLGLGFVPDYPIVMEDGGMYMISNGTTRTYDGELERYFYYEPKESGTLVFGASSYLQLQYINQASTEWETVQGQYSIDDRLFNTTIPVNAGEPILLLAVAQGGNTCLIKSSQIKLTGGDGSRPTMAFVLGDHNTVPEHFGRYWYRYDAQQTGYAVVSGDAVMPGGQVHFYGSSASYIEYSSKQGSFDLRFPVTAGISYYLSIDKVETSAEETPFDVAFEAPKNGDHWDYPEVLEFDANGKALITTPAYSNQKYFYAVDMQDPNDNYELRVRCTNPVSEVADWTQLIVYPYGNMYYGSGQLYGGQALTKGTTLVTDWSLAQGNSSTVPAGRYFIFVEKYEYVPLTFLVEKITIEEGDVLSRPIYITSQGVQDIPAKDEVYYAYTATQDGFLTLLLDDPQLEATFYQDGNRIQVDRNGLEYRLKIHRGLTYAFCIQGAGEGFYTFNFNVSDFTQGQSPDLPLPVTGDIALGAEVMDAWYEFPITYTGVLDLTADLTDKNASVGYILNHVKGTEHPVETSIISSISESELLNFGVQLPVKEGDVITVHVKTTLPQPGCKVFVNLRDYLPGETLANPLVLTAEQPLANFRTATRYLPTYVRIPVQQGFLRLFSTQVIVGTLYRNDHLTSAIGDFTTTKFCYDDEGLVRFYMDTQVSEPSADYYMLITMGGGDNSELSMTQVDPAGITSVQADQKATVTYDLMGRRSRPDGRGLKMVDGKKIYQP